MTSNIYKNHLLRRWEMNEDGVIGCFKEAIDIRLHSNTVCDAVNTHNELLLTAEKQKNDYLGSLNISEPTEEPLTITTINENDEEVEVDNPVWVQYNTAQGIIANTPNTVIAWVNSFNRPFEINLETGEPNENYETELSTWEGYVQVRNETYINTAPSFTVVTDGAALYDLTPSQFWALINANDLGAAIDAAFDTMYPNPEDAIAREFARSSFNKATYYKRTDPLFDVMGPIVGLSKAQIDAMWMMAKDLKRD